MKKYKFKFILMSFSFLIIFITAFATTYAWVGIFTYANTEKFTINLKTVDFKSNYFLTISSSGEVGTFSDTVAVDDLRKQVLNNMGINTSRLQTSEAISYAYINATNELNPVTTLVDDNNKFAPFKKLSLESYDGTYDPVRTKYLPGYVNGNNNYICFDLYLSVDTKEGISENTVINAPVFMTELENMIIGTVGTHKVLNNNFVDFDYTDNERQDLLPSLPVLYSIPTNQTIKVDSSNAIRVGFEIYNPIDINDSYDENNSIVKSNYIYYWGDVNPSIDDKGVYDLGGILPTEFNTAAQELMNIRSYLYVDVPDDYINRNDLKICEENSQILQRATDVSSPSNYLGVQNGIQTKMKIRVYFWFEGWDSDCLLGIKSQNVMLNLAFTADRNED